MAALTESELPQTGRALRWRLASDAVLTRAAASGAEGAFDEIFSRYQPALVRHCRAVLLDADEAQDAAQNALTAALRALRRGTSEPVSLKAWLYRIAHNESVALARRRADQQARRAPGDGSEAELVAVAGPADDDTRERLRELVVDLRELPDRQRNALLLRELSGLEYGEVAEVLGTSAGAARQTVFEARAALMDIGAGRIDGCDGVQRVLSDGDGRMRRGRRVRAHLRGCGACTAFAAQIDARERDLALVFPLGPVLAFFGSGAGAASLTGAGAVAGGGWSLGIGASVAIKCATVCTAAAVLGTITIDDGQNANPLHHGSNKRSVQIASAAPHSTRSTPIVLTPGHSAPARARSRVTTSPTAVAGRRIVSHASAAPSPRHTATAHLPAVAPQHSQASAGDATTAAAQTTQASASAPAAPATAKKQLASFGIPAVAQQAIAAVTNFASGAIQHAMTAAQGQVTQGMTLAQQITSQVMRGLLGHDTASANAPASADSP